MSIFGEKTKRFAANGIFPSLFLGSFGFVLTQALVARMHGSWQLHAILGIPGIALAGLVFYRARMHWAAGVDEIPVQTANPRQSSNTRDVAWYFFLLGTGIVVSISAISASLIGIVATLMYLVPWRTIPVCRTHFIRSSIVMLTGAVASLAVYASPIHIRQDVVAAWMVFIPAAIMHFLVLVSLPKGYRVRDSAQVKHPGLDADLPLPQ